MHLFMFLTQIVKQSAGSPHRLFGAILGLGWNNSLGEYSAVFPSNNCGYLCSAQVYAGKNLKTVRTHVSPP